MYMFVYLARPFARMISRERRGWLLSSETPGIPVWYKMHETSGKRGKEEEFCIKVVSKKGQGKIYES